MVSPFPRSSRVKRRRWVRRGQRLSSARAVSARMHPGMVSAMRPSLPPPRGPLSERLCALLRHRPHASPGIEAVAEGVLSEEDAQLSLLLCFGLHYDGFAGVDDEWEWNESLVAVTTVLERRFLDTLGFGTGPVDIRPVSARELVTGVEEMLAGASGPSLSTFLLERGTLEQLREFVIHRSIYQRKEADPHTWVLPRLRGRAKSACVLLQSDEYGNGRPGRAHADLFADTMRAFGLDPAPGAYVDLAPAATLATDNLISLLGLHRRWRGALVGHLAAFEMTSVIPMERYARAVRKFLPAEAAEFYDVHVVADAVHEQVATEELLTGLVETDPAAARDVTLGVAALLEVEQQFTQHLLSAWEQGTPSLCTANDGWTRSWPSTDGSATVRPPVSVRRSGMPQVCGIPRGASA